MRGFAYRILIPESKTKKKVGEKYEKVKVNERRIYFSNALPKGMKGIEKSMTVLRSYVIVKSQMAKSAF